MIDLMHRGMIDLVHRGMIDDQVTDDRVNGN
jgi:hypothetical protein